MYLTDVKTDLFTFFGTHDSFSLLDNFDDLYILCEKEKKDLTKGLITKALEEYEQQKIVVKVIHDNKTTWVLDKPLERYSQTIELSYPTLASLTKIVNNYCEETKNKDAKVNPLDIQERDIQSLIVLVHQALGAGNV